KIQAADPRRRSADDLLLGQHRHSVGYRIVRSVRLQADLQGDDRMKKLLKSTAIVIVVLAVCGFLAFLYFIPPFLTAAPETFSKPIADAPPTVNGIADPAERAIAERGRAIVTRTGCIG